MFKQLLYFREEHFADTDLFSDRICKRHGWKILRRIGPLSLLESFRLKRELHQKKYDAIVVPLRWWKECAWMASSTVPILVWMDRSSPSCVSTLSSAVIVPHLSFKKELQDHSSNQLTCFTLLPEGSSPAQHRRLPERFGADSEIGYVEAQRWSKQGLQSFLSSLYVIHFVRPKIKIIIHGPAEVMTLVHQFCDDLKLNDRVLLRDKPMLQEEMNQVHFWCQPDREDSISSSYIRFLHSQKPILLAKGAIHACWNEEHPQILEVVHDDPVGWSKALYSLDRSEKRTLKPSESTTVSYESEIEHFFTFLNQRTERHLAMRAAR